MLKNDNRCGAEMNTTASFTGMNMDYTASMEMPNCCQMDPCMSTMCPPIYECPQERVCHRTINYEVPQV